MVVTVAVVLISVVPVVAWLEVTFPGFEGFTDGFEVRDEVHLWVAVGPVVIPLIRNDMIVYF